MNQTDQILDALKKCLKARGLTYRDVAPALGVSEASVKRIFSERTFTLARLEDLCRYLDMNIYELAKMTQMFAEDEPRELSDSQEQGLANDPTRLVYFYLLINGWSPARIARKFQLDQSHNTRMLAALDRLKLIELLPRSRVRLLTGRRINWRHGGPVRRLYEGRVKAEFLASRFGGADEMLRFESGELSDASIKLLRRKMKRLAQEFDEFAELDMHQPAEKKRSFALMLAIRPWTMWSIIDVPE